VTKSAIRRLYESDAAGVRDDELLDEVGISLLLRCRDILAIEQARHGVVTCPRCQSRGNESLIRRVSGPRDELLRCPSCAWQMTWTEYRRTFQRRQLHSGGAGKAFRAFAAGYPQARTAAEKMLLIDRLIHEFHYSLRGEPGHPTRAACVNLIQGRLTDVVAFLDELTYGNNAVPQIAQTRDTWRANVDAMRSAWGKARECIFAPPPERR
jgi:hypothetical protein